MRARNNFSILNVLIIYSFLFLSLTYSISNAGTGDFAGGGNGSQNKVYESNITSLVKLPIYNKYIKPRLDKFDSLMDQLAQRDEKSKFSYSQFLIRMKSWYFTDDTLKSLDKETLGVLFSEDNSQQIALNKKKEIWIDNKIFSRMKESHQADLIIHEIVMNLYFLKYYSFYDLCIIGKEMGQYNENEENNLTCEQIKNIKLFQTKQSMVLKEDDYQNIRRVTSWFINDLMDASADDLFNKLRYNEFDKRLITKSDTQKNDIKVTGRDAENLLLKMKYTDSFPDICKSSLSTTNLNCQISIQNTENPYGPNFNKLEFQIDDSNSTKTISFNISNKNSSISSPIQSADGLSYFTLSFKSNEAPLVLTDSLGAKYYFLTLFFSPTDGAKTENAELIGYSLVPYAITSISQPKNDSIFTECEINRLNLKKHPAYIWGSEERTEIIAESITGYSTFSKSYCILRSEEKIKQMKADKIKIDNYLKSFNQQISKVIGRRFEFSTYINYSGKSLNTLSKFSETSLNQKMNDLKSCSEREVKNNRVCSMFKTLKFINEDTVLVDDKYTCNINFINQSDVQINSNYKLNNNSGIILNISCNDAKIVMQSSPTGSLFYSNGSLSFKSDVYEYNTNFFQTETLYKEIP